VVSYIVQIKKISTRMGESMINCGALIDRKIKDYIQQNWLLVITILSCYSCSLFFPSGYFVARKAKRSLSSSDAEILRNYSYLGESKSEFLSSRRIFRFMFSGIIYFLRGCGTHIFSIATDPTGGSPILIKDINSVNKLVQPEGIEVKQGDLLSYINFILDILPHYRIHDAHHLVMISDRSIGSLTERLSEHIVIISEGPVTNHFVDVTDSVINSFKKEGVPDSVIKKAIVGDDRFYQLKSDFQKLTDFLPKIITTDSGYQVEFYCWNRIINGLEYRCWYIKRNGSVVERVKKRILIEGFQVEGEK